MKKEDLQKFITGVDKTNITDKMLALPSHFFSMVYELELLENNYLVVEHELDVMKSKVYRDLSLTYKNIKSMTPTAINHQINCREEIVNKTVTVIGLSKKIGILKSKIKSLNVFSEMLTNVGHNYRNEKQNIKKGV